MSHPVHVPPYKDIDNNKTEDHTTKAL